MKLTSFLVTKLSIVGYSNAAYMYKFLSQRQGTRFAITAVHTKEEIDLFKKLLIEKKK